MRSNNQSVIILKNTRYVVKKSVVNHDGSLYNLLMFLEAEVSEEENTSSQESEKLQFLFDKLDSQIWFIGKSNQYSLINESCAKFLGLDKSNISNKSIDQLLNKDESAKLESEVNKVKSENVELLSYEYLTNSAGEKRFFSVRKIPYLANDGNVETVICIAEDQTDMNKHEEEIKEYIEELHETKDLMEQNAYELVELNLKLEESEEELKKLNASKDKFFSIISHDLKTPVSAMMSYSEILNDEYDSLGKDEILDFIGSLKEVSANLFELLEGLLNWSRVQTGRMEYSPEVINLSDIIYNLNRMYKQSAQNKNIKLTTSIDGTGMVYADDNMINTVLRNLISNAIKFTNENGEVKVMLNDKDNHVLVSVVDDGIGIKDDDLHKLFRIDVHHTTTGTANEAGTGLGLILCKELVEKNGGIINVKSDVGTGTTFYFTLPKSKELI